MLATPVPFLNRPYWNLILRNGKATRLIGHHLTRERMKVDKNGHFLAPLKIFAVFDLSCQIFLPLRTTNPIVMAKSKDARKNVKKEAVLTPKEKKAAKREKKGKRK